MPNKFKSLDIATDDYKSADAINPEGFPAWKMNNEERLVQLLHTGTMESVFYASQKVLVKEAVLVFENTPVELLEKWIPIGRNKGFMRASPILALTILFEKDIAAARRIFNKVIRTGNDLTDFLDARKARGHGFGRGVKSIIKNWLKENLTEFYAIKYGNEITRGIRVSRPSPKEMSKEKNRIIKYLTRDLENKWHSKWWDEDNQVKENLQKIWAFEEIKTVDPKNLDKIKELIEIGKLDYSVLTMLPKSPELWKIMMKEMGVFALIRHLVTFERNGLNQDQEVVDFLFGPKGRINSDNMLKARVLPFRLFQAFQMVKTSEFKNAVANVMEEFVPKWDFSHWGRVAVCPDCSGSMENSIGRYRFGTKIPSLRYADISSLFGAVLYKGISNSDIFPWDDTLYAPPPKNDSIASISKFLLEGVGGGTYMELPLKYMLDGHIGTKHTEDWFGRRYSYPFGAKTKREVRGIEKPASWRSMKFDTLIWITDSIEWGEGWLTWWKKYKRLFPNAKAILIRIDSYSSRPFPDELRDELSITQIFGWSNSVIDYIEYILYRDKTEN